MKVAVIGEYSGIVRDAFIMAGHDAVSCDLLPSESSLGPHIQGDFFDHDFSLCDLIIMHHPCTYLSVSGNRWYSGTEKRKEAIKSAESWWLRYHKIPTAFENPVGVLSSQSIMGPATQYIQPWMFGHGEVKKTGLWLRDLPKLEPTNIVEGREQRIWKMGPSKKYDRQKERSKFYIGIAAAMAEQWGNL